MLTEKRMRLIYLEITFSKMYEKLPRITDHGFDLYAFYEFHFQDNGASLTDALSFVLRKNETMEVLMIEALRAGRPIARSPRARRL